MTFIKEEPIRFWAAITGVFFAALAVAVGFDWLSFTEVQMGLLLAFMTACGVLFQFFFVRNKVSPFPPVESK